MTLKTPIHILIIPSWYPQTVGDIGGSFFREQAIALRKRGNEVGVIAPSIRSMRDWKGILLKPYGLEQEVDEGVSTYRWHSVNFTPRLQGIFKARWLAAGMKLFDSYIKDNGIPDIIHVHSLLNAGFIAQKISLKYDIPYVITEHSSAFSRGLVNEVIFEQLQTVVEDSAKNIAVSNAFKLFLDSKFVSKPWDYLPNIVNDEFLNSDLEYNNINKGFTFINICILSENKKVDVLIKAFAEVSKNIQGLKLKIGGDGPIKMQLVDLVNELGLSESVDFLGSLSRKDVLTQISCSDAFVLASEYETFGVVLIEALALGKPVVATCCGGPESIVVPEVGYLVDKNSVESLAHGMMELYNHRDKYSAEDIREYCCCHFSEAAVVDKLTNIYSNVLNKSLYDSQ